MPGSEFQLELTPAVSISESRGGRAPKSASESESEHPKSEAPAGSAAPNSHGITWFKNVLSHSHCWRRLCRGLGGHDKQETIREARAVIVDR